MPTLTDCERWLDGVNLTSVDAVYSLYNTVFNEEGCGGFQCSNKGLELYIRSSDSDNWLLIPSVKARNNFLDVLKVKYCGGEDIRRWYKERGGNMGMTG
jgi:hypothetical protein